MKIDHLVMNVSECYHLDSQCIETIRSAGYPYQPKWGKGTRGFKATNLWIGNEYLEMIRLLRADGGGWKSDWVSRYNDGHRGVICLMLDVSDLDVLYKKMTSKGLTMTEPQYLQFRWFFNLFNRKMPWRNSYLDFFEGVPFQIGFQQMKNEKALAHMRQFMVPNARENGIDGIKTLIIKGNFSKGDFDTIAKVFDVSEQNDHALRVNLLEGQGLVFEKSKSFAVEMVTQGIKNVNGNHSLKIENLTEYTVARI